MKNQTNAKLAIRSSLALILAVAIWPPALVRSAEPEVGMMTETNMMPRAGAMKEQRQKMMAELKAQDEKLNTQIKEMNRAPADKKLDLMAVIVTLMADQRTARNAHMGMIQPAMMPSQPAGMKSGANQPMDSTRAAAGKLPVETKWMADRTAQDAQLAGQISEMNRAPADKKLNLMAVVITTMAEQRTASNVRMEKMQEEMMALREMGKEPISPDAMMEGYQENFGSTTNQSQP